MLDILAPLTPEYALILPDGTIAIIAWLIGFCSLILLSYFLCDQKMKFERQPLIWLAVLSVLIVVLTPFIGVLPRLGIPTGTGEMPIQHLMFFAAVPWMVAGGVLGIFPATLLAGLSGLFLAYLDTQNSFTPIVLMSVALVYSWAIRQRFRTPLFKWLRFPISAAIMSLMMNVPVILFTMILSVPGSMAARMANAVSRLPLVMFSLGGMVLMGGVVSVIVQAYTQSFWGNQATLKPAPGETKILSRLLFYGVPIFILALTGVFITSWRISENYLRQVMVRQMTASSISAAKSLIVFFDTGERLINELALELEQTNNSPQQIDAALQRIEPGVGFFEHVAVIGTDGLITGSSPTHLGLDDGLLENLEGLKSTLRLSETTVSFVLTGGEGYITRVVFLTGIGDLTQADSLVIWAETTLEENLFAAPFFSNMNLLVQQGGGWRLIGKDLSDLFSMGDDDARAGSSTSTFITATFSQTRTADGQTLLYHFQPVEGKNIGLEVMLPQLVIQEQVWQIAYPVLVISTILLSLALVLILLIFTPVANEIDQMAKLVDDAAYGSDDINVFIDHAGNHKGRLAQAFQKLLVSQQQKMDKQAALLSVTGKIAGQLNSKDALYIIMSAALDRGATAARVALINHSSIDLWDENERFFGLGRHAKLLATYDQEVLDLSRGEGVLVLSNEELNTHLPGVDGFLTLNSVIVLPLNWKDLRLGVLWFAFGNDQTFDASDQSFYVELAKMASLAIVNAKTYADSRSAQTFWQEIYELIPDAIIISDSDGKVVINNRHAPKIMGLPGESLEGQSVLELLNFEDGLKIDQISKYHPLEKMVNFPNGRCVYLIASPVKLNHNELGLAMILADKTQQLKTESMNVELVTIVSHELRSPLTLILGYAKILQLAGSLNAQQGVYIGNIIDGLNGMSALVDKLLDIERLEGGDGLEIETFPAAQFTQRLVAGMEAHAKQKNIEIHLNFPDVPLLIEADQAFIAQALKNLLENAIKFSKVGGEVVLSVVPKQDRVVFSVRDKGIGIAPLDQRKLFKKFGRVSVQNSQDQEGSGLGLAIVKSIVERHGGSVRLESQLGVGSTFSFEIPIKHPR